MRTVARRSLRATPQRSQQQSIPLRHCHRPQLCAQQHPLPQRRHASSDDAPQTHYDFFPATLPRGAPPQGPFAIDLRALRSEFLRQQAVAHPDRHPSGEAKRRAEALSARINEAYKVLTDPLMRAQYVLGLRGVDVAGDETAKVEDPELLMQVLEAREVIEGAEGEVEVRALQEENEGVLAASVAEVERLLEAADWDAAAAESVRLRYWVNIREACVNWEPGKPVTLQH